MAAPSIFKVHNRRLKCAITLLHFKTPHYEEKAKEIVSNILVLNFGIELLIEKGRAFHKSICFMST